MPEASASHYQQTVDSAKEQLEFFRDVCELAKSTATSEIQIGHLESTIRRITHKINLLDHVRLGWDSIIVQSSIDNIE